MSTPASTILHTHAKNVREASRLNGAWTNILTLMHLHHFQLIGPNSGTPPSHQPDGIVLAAHSILRANSTFAAPGAEQMSYHKALRGLDQVWSLRRGNLRLFHTAINEMQPCSMQTTSLMLIAPFTPPTLNKAPIMKSCEDLNRSG